MDNVTVQLLKITGYYRYPEDCNWESPEGPWEGPEGECEAVLSIGEALFGAFLEAKREIREAENGPLNALSVKRDRYSEILSLTAKYAVRRNLDNNFLGSTLPELREPIALAIAFERGINYARVLRDYYAEVAARLEQSRTRETNKMNYTYRGLREFNPLDIGATWDSVSEWYFNPHQQCFECLHDGHHITLTPDLIGYQDGRIHITYRNGPDEAWLECLPEPGQHYLRWRLIARSGEIRKEMVANWHGYAEHSNLRWLWGDFDCLPKAILVLVVAAVIKSAGYKGKGMFLHEVNPACIREDWMYPYISLPAGISDEEKEKIHDCFDRYGEEES